MKKHVRVYMAHYGYGEQDFVPCEACRSMGRTAVRAVDVHHIDGRLGESANTIGNLIGLCRNHHIAAHTGKISATELKEIVDKRRTGDDG